MSPDKAASVLRRIAAKIDASDRPSMALVRRDLRLLAASLIRDQRVARVAREMLRIAQDDLEASLWDTDEGKDLEEGMKFTRKQDDVDKLVPALKSLKHDVDDFIAELKREPGEKADVIDEDVTTSAPPRHEMR
jgi:hypothetical protein